MPFPRLLRPALAALAGLLLSTPALRAQASDSIPVAARDLPRGVALTAEDLAFALRPASVDSGAARGRVGWTTRRVISAGEPLVEPAVAPPNLVEAGQTVQAVWRHGAIELRLSGQATGPAALGERVLVRVDARRRVAGVVVGPALVRLESPDRSR